MAQQRQYADSAISKDKSQQSLWKDYVLCSCLEYGFKEDSLANKDFSAGLLLEMMEYSLEDKTSLDSAAKAFVDTIPVANAEGAVGKRGIMVNCLDYYRSPQLNAMVSRLREKYKPKGRAALKNKR